ncbi:TIM23 complex component [Microbotryomycetes sp. JL221]|nr:TIM23 complex component [Microbotryomycetes sp. JL221]
MSARRPTTMLSSRITSQIAPRRRFNASALPRRAASTSNEAAAHGTPKLDWPTYFDLRKSQRRVGLVTSIPTTFLGFSLGANYFATKEADPTDTIMGIEPIWAYAIATVACGALGWLAGPSLGNQMWRLTHRRVLQSMEVKEREFFEHVKRMRVDPSRQSVSNPVPDYYAEKVHSLKGYRQWLRDQSAYRRKAQFGSGEDKVL